MYYDNLFRKWLSLGNGLDITTYYFIAIIIITRSFLLSQSTFELGLFDVLSSSVEGCLRVKTQFLHLSLNCFHLVKSAVL